MPRFKDPDTGNELFWNWECADKLLQTNKFKDKVLKP
jgi:hypothetical protein